MARASLTLWSLLLWVAVVACNLVHDLGTHEHQSLVSLDVESPLVGEATGASRAKSADEIAADEISALAGDIRKKLPVIADVKEKKNTGASRAWAKDAATFVGRLKKLHKRLMERNLELRAELGSPGTGDNKLQYGHVKGMMLTQQAGKPVGDVPNSDSCELMCSTDRNCKSFSYNADEAKCIISNTALGYSPDSVFYAKAEVMEGEAMKYRMFPGLFEANRNKNPLRGISEVRCQMACTQQGHLCHGFSYRANKQLCSFATAPLEYNKHWQYFEKPPRQFNLGDPQEIKAEDDADLLKRQSDHFWKRFKYENNEADKRKLRALKAAVDEVMEKADVLEAKLRSTQSEHSRVSARAAELGRASKRLESGLRSAAKQVVEAKGKQKEKKIAITLVHEKLEQRKEQLVEEDPDFHEKGRDFNDDPIIQQTNEELMQAPKILAKSQEAVMNAQLNADDAHREIQETDQAQIKAMMKTKALAQSLKTEKLKMKQLAVKALDMKKMLEQLEKSMSPPPATMAPPSGRSSRPWDVKADEANAKETLFFMSPAEKRMLNAKQSSIDKSKAAADDNKEGQAKESGSA